ncbi:hypothetical protein GCM10011403_09940 [Pseudohongiella nitratireducens]|jgi:flagellar basal body-associated protein FliL|uniref:Antitermination protein NusG n=1 Tax=Pseudohongiella nitratireducens TaxID=1768907 RepID=A0A917LSF9_9GAMM|nr:hypothetical protein [Pseudohongiella nitratireducens]GGG54854.1 hypothetical protein GCM10011403_09940 [Pseudohongiella nitratireducens]
MLSKLLITLLVMVVAVIYLRYRRRAANHSAASGRQSEQASGSTKVTAFLGQAEQMTQKQASRKNRLTILFWIVMTTILVSAMAWTLWSWREQQQELTILLHDSGSASPVVYRVRRKDLHDDFFITTDGVRVVVSQSERMEVIGL